jgi:hypothetical protein
LSNLIIQRKKITYDPSKNCLIPKVKIGDVWYKKIFVAQFKNTMRKLANGDNVSVIPEEIKLA